MLRIGVICLCLMLSVVATGLAAGDGFTFGGLAFGVEPGDGMLCIRGNCPEGVEQISRRISFPSATYLFDRDTTHWGIVPITPPEYDFFRDQLYRVRFRLLCRSSEELACLRLTRAEIDRRYGFEHLDGADFSLADNVMAYEEIGNLGPETIYSISLMEKVRISSNPNYKPGSNR